jgi:hypothetical protein
LTNNNKQAAPKKPPYNNIDYLEFKSLSELMGWRKAKFLDLQELLVDLETTPTPF